MRILMLEPAARDQHPGIDQSLDHRLVGVALLAFVGQHALAGKARRLIGEAAVGVDGVGDSGTLMPRSASLTTACHPDIKVLAAVPRRSVDESCAGFFGHVVTFEQRHWEIIITSETL